MCQGLLVGLADGTKTKEGQEEERVGSEQEVQEGEEGEEKGAAEVYESRVH